MDQPITVATDTHYMTREFLESQLVQNKERIAQLEEAHARTTQRSFTESAERTRMRNEMQEWTLEAIENGTITEDTAQEIADICGFELTKEFEVEVTVLYSVTVNARNEEEATNAIHDIDFDTVQYNDENISWLSSSIDRVDI
jgi:AraC-like DNA-binding protein